MRAAHPQGENPGNTRSRRVDHDSACSYRTRPFQSLGAHPASEHRCSVLDSDRFGHESAKIHRWSITAASRGAPRRARTKANSPKVSLGHVLAHHARHLEHVNLRHRQDFLEGRIRGDNTTSVQLVLLDVSPELL